MQRNLKTVMLAVALATLVIAGRAAADQPELPPKGMGKYLIVLWEPGTPIPGKKDERMKRVAEPNFAQLGGRLLHKDVNRRVVFLPFAAAKNLRRHEAVSFVQRIWVGEPLSEWNEDDSVVALKAGEISADSESFTWDKSYSYDADGNITNIGADEFGYDDMGRLTSAVVSGKPETYSYDAFGNLIGIGWPGGPGISMPAEASSNRLVGETYDAAGNVTSRKDRGEYAFDALNMLTEYRMASAPSRRILYDANDERIATLDGGQERWTIRDFDGQVLREFKGNGLESGSMLPWTWEQDHIRGEGQLIAGETVTWSYWSGSTNFSYGGKRHYHLDHLGSVRVVTNAAGKAIAENDFSAFGAAQTRQFQEQINEGDPHTDGMRFAGHWRDFMGHARTEGDDYLDNMHARHYDPNGGRFLSPDPVLGNLLQPQSWNRYAYVASNPVNYVDPYGLRSVPSSGPFRPDWCNTPVCEEFDYDDDPGGANGKTISFRDVGGFFAWYVEFTERAQHFNHYPSVASARAMMDVPGAMEFADVSDDAAKPIQLGLMLQAAAVIPGDLPVAAADDVVIVSRWGRSGLEAGDWVMKGRVNWWNYIWSGKWQPGFGNQFARYSSGQQYRVMRSTTRWPRGFGIDGWIKGLLGQRRYLP